MDASEQGGARRWPRGLIVLVLLGVGGFGGLAVAGLSATVLQRTSQDDFCLACHEMQPFADEFVGTSHFANAAGVRAGCADCHLPQHDWLDYTLAKAKAGVRDVWAHFVLGMNTPDALLERRHELAETVWERMQANDSRFCRNCHDAEAMDFAAQSPAAGAVHGRVLDGGERTCIDCHKGMAHALPEEAKALR